MGLDCGLDCGLGWDSTGTRLGLDCRRAIVVWYHNSMSICNAHHTCTTWGSTRVIIPGTQHLSQGTVDGQYYAPLWRV